MDKYNTFLFRFCAGLLDGLVVFPIWLLTSYLEDTNTFLIIVGNMVDSVAFCAYSVYCHWQSGQTLGKKWMGIRVVYKDENRLLTLEEAFKRDIGYIVLSALGLIYVLYETMFDSYSSIGSPVDWLGTAWFWLEVITMFANDKRRALHDMLANSVVIKDEYWKQENHPETT